jgi:hypothetical protein
LKGIAAEGEHLGHTDERVGQLHGGGADAGEGLAGVNEGAGVGAVHHQAGVINTLWIWQLVSKCKKNLNMFIRVAEPHYFVAVLVPGLKNYVALTPTLVI